MRKLLAILPLVALWAAPAATALEYFRVPKGQPAAGASTPDNSANTADPAQVDPAVTASGAPAGPSTVGDGITVKFTTVGLGANPSFVQTGGAVPSLTLSQDGTLSGSLTTTGIHDFSVMASGNGKTASSTVRFDTRWYPPQLTLAAPSGSVFRGIPFSLQASSTNGASITQWAMGTGLPGTVDATGLTTVEAPIDQSGGNTVAVTGTDAWGQAGSATQALSFATPSASLSLPAKMRGGQTYSAQMLTNLPSPTWSSTSINGGSATVSGKNLLVMVPAVATQQSVSASVSAASGKASASASASGAVLPPLTFTTQPTAVTALRATGQLTYNPPQVTGRLGTIAFALTDGGTDVSDNMSTGCPGFSFSRQTGVISGQPNQGTCNKNFAYAVTDGGDGTAPQSTVNSSAFLFKTQSNPSFSVQPSATYTVVQGQSATATATLAQDGGYVAPLQFWRVTNGSNSGDAMPPWASLNCATTSSTCNVTLAPPTSLAAGTYGPYAIMAGDGTGFYKASSTFSVNVAASAFYVLFTESNINVSVGTTFQTRPTVNRTSSSTSISGTVQWSLVGDDGTASGIPTWLTKGTSTNDGSSGYSYFNASPPAGTATGIYPQSGGSYRVRAVDASGFVAYSSPFTVTVYDKVPVASRPVAAVAGGGPVSFTQLCTSCTPVSVSAAWTGSASIPLSVDSKANPVDVLQYDFGQPVYISTAWMLSTTQANNMNFQFDYWDGNRWNDFTTARGNYNDAFGWGSSITARYVRVRQTVFINYPFTVYAAKLKFGDANAKFAP